MRNKITEEMSAEVFGVSQSCISANYPAADEASRLPGCDHPGRRTRWPCWSWSGKHKVTGHSSLVISNYDGDILYMSDPVTRNRHDMRRLADSESEKGFTGTDYITTPVRKPKHRELYIREKEYNAEVSSHRAPVERAVAQLTTWRILFSDSRRPLESLSGFLQDGHRTPLLRALFCICPLAVPCG
jgi:DDE superfamily endonuclease